MSVCCAFPKWRDTPHPGLISSTTDSVKLLLDTNNPACTTTITSRGEATIVCVQDFGAVPGIIEQIQNFTQCDVSLTHQIVCARAQATFEVGWVNPGDLLRTFREYSNSYYKNYKTRLASGVAHLVSPSGNIRASAFLAKLSAPSPVQLNFLYSELVRCAFILQAATPSNCPPHIRDSPFVQTYYTWRNLVDQAGRRDHLNPLSPTIPTRSPQSSPPLNIILPGVLGPELDLPSVPQSPWAPHPQ